MEEKKMTIEEVLEITVQNLRSITLPVDLCETVGMTIIGSINNLNMCLSAMKAANVPDGGNENEPEADTE
jgi:hypothetical protein